METVQVSNHLKGHFLRLYQMAMTDGDFSPLEWRMLYKIGESRNVPREDLDRILTTVSGKIEIPEDVETRIEYLYDLTKMMWADGVLSEDELITIKKYCKKFEFLDENIDELVNRLSTFAKEDLSVTDVLTNLKEQ